MEENQLNQASIILLQYGTDTQMDDALRDIMANTAYKIAQTMTSRRKIKLYELFSWHAISTSLAMKGETSSRNPQEKYSLTFWKLIQPFDLPMWM